MMAKGGCEFQFKELGKRSSWVEPVEWFAASDVVRLSRYCWSGPFVGISHTGGTFDQRRRRIS